MKKILLTTTIILIALFGVNAQNVNIPDANFKNVLINHNPVIDTNNDDEISVAEALAYTGAIQANGASISDLTGLEAFANITTLSANNNQITTIDISNNTALVSLFLDGNLLTHLDIANRTFNSLGFSNNPNLSKVIANNIVIGGLYISNCPQLDTIILSGSPNLSQLNLSTSNGQISFLDITSCPLLNTLNCADNKLTSLDLSSHSALAFLDCRNNRLNFLSIKNGNNTNLIFCRTSGQRDTAYKFTLNCIEVDNFTTSNAWTGSSFAKDANAIYNTNCTDCYVVFTQANLRTNLVANTNINTNNDNMIQCSEAATYNGTIYFNNTITYSKGLEAFTSLTDLYVNRYEDTSYTFLYSMPNLTKLTIPTLYNQYGYFNLDFSQNTALTRIDIPSAEYLQNINLSNLSSLTYLRLGYCLSLTAIDLTDCIALDTLIGSDVGISGPLVFDLSNSPNLKQLSWIYGYANRGPVSLDLSHCSLLSDVDLYQNQNLTSLNVKNGNNTNFTRCRTMGCNDSLCIEVDDVAYCTTNWTGSNYYKPNNATYSLNCNLINSLSTPKENGFSIFPNPTSTVLNILLNTQGETNIELYDLAGKQVKSTITNDAQNQLNVEDLNAGIYLIKITNNNEVFTSKFVKE